MADWKHGNVGAVVAQDLGSIPFVTLSGCVGFTTLNGTMKPKVLPILLILLSAALCLGRTGSDDDTAHAIMGALRLQESMSDPGSLQISSAIVTNKGVCIEYRRRNGGLGSGFAVYKTDKDFIWVDNSWLWDQVCVAGKYGQRRVGKDVTDAVSAAIERKQAAAPAVQLVVPAARVDTIALPTKVPAAQVVPVSVAPVQDEGPSHRARSAGLPQPRSAQSQLSLPLSFRARRPRRSRPHLKRIPWLCQLNSRTDRGRPVAVVVAPVSAVPAAKGQPKVAAVAAQASVPSASSYAVSSAPVASVELGTIRGVTIVDNGGALEKKGPPPPPESLGDAARRLRQSKQK